MSENSYNIVQTSEHTETYLSVLPSLWTLKNGWKSYEPDESDDGDSGDDLCYWPKGFAGYRLLEKAMKDPNIKPNLKVLHACRCKIKKIKFPSYSEALQELNLMEINLDTEQYEAIPKIRKVSATANFFKQIQQPKNRKSAAAKPDDKSSKSPSSHTDNETQHDMGRNSASQLKINENYEYRLSGFGHKLSLNLSSVNDSSTETSEIYGLLRSLHDKVDKHTKIIEECTRVGNRSVALLSQVNAKLDALTKQVNMKHDTIVPLPAQSSMSSETRSVPLSPVKSEKELEILEKKASDIEFVDAVVQYIGSMHGKNRYIGKGGTVCLQIVDYFFAREFLMNCSWTGTSRRSDKINDSMSASKIPFHKFDGVINLFHKVVMFSDPSYPWVDCQNFMKRCLRNAKQRFVETKGIRAPVTRKRRKRFENPSVLFRINDDEERLEEDEQSLMDSEETHPDEVKTELADYIVPDEIEIADSKFFIDAEG